MELRPTTVEDLPALHELFLDATGGLYRTHAFAPPSPPREVFEAQQRHVLATGRSVVAIEDGDPAGFASAWTRGADWFLASLFVTPRVQSRGLGTALLDAVWGEAASRRTITDAIQPVSNALYARRGLVPVTPVLVFFGVPVGAAAVLEDGGSGDRAELARLDAAAYGFDRAVDHAFWNAAARRTIWLRGDEAVAYSYSFPGGSVGAVAGLDERAAAGALESELARTADSATVRIPGSSRTLVELALRCRLRLTATPGLLLCSEGVAPPTSLALGGYTLF